MTFEYVEKFEVVTLCTRMNEYNTYRISYNKEFKTEYDVIVPLVLTCPPGQAEILCDHQNTMYSSARHDAIKEIEDALISIQDEEYTYA